MSRTTVQTSAHLPALRRMQTLGATVLAVAAAATVLALSLSAPAVASPGGRQAHGEMHAGMHAGMHGGGADGGMGMMGGKHLERALDRAGATAEQKAQIRQIAEATRSDLKAQHEAGKSLHEQQRALMAQPNIDARAAETLRQQKMAQHDAVSKRMLQSQLDMARVLTPEQRQQLTQMMEQRRSQMQRHRSEREALDSGSR